jgi:hypothetical protein
MTRVPNLMTASVSKIALLLLVTLAGWRCLDSPDFPDEPYIEFLGLSKDTIRQGNFQEDSLFVVFRFEDGDGDLGRNDQDPENNIFFIDERTGTLDNTFGLPAIPEEGASNGVEGEISILLFSTCCIFPDGSDPCTISEQYPMDTVQYRIYIKDRAGHKSNEILTSPIILRCN